MSTAAVWRKSSYSGSDADSCVEITVCPDAVLVRDSKAMDGPQLAVPVQAWEAFIGFAATGA